MHKNHRFAGEKQYYVESGDVSGPSLPDELIDKLAESNGDLEKRFIGAWKDLFQRGGLVTNIEPSDSPEFNKMISEL